MSNTLAELIEQLQLISDDQLQPVYSQDEEGNGFHLVNSSPQVGHYTEDGEFYHSAEHWVEEYPDEPFIVNAVCIN